MHHCGLCQVPDLCTLNPSEKLNITFNKHNPELKNACGLAAQFFYVTLYVVSCANGIYANFYTGIYLLYVYICVRMAHTISPPFVSS